MLRSWLVAEQRWQDPDVVAQTPIRDLCVPSDNCIWSEWTSLYDRHGRPVYEGDIVRCFSGFFDSFFTVAVRWSMGIMQDDCSTVPLIVAGFIIGSLGDIEVVGNIWETPDLLR